MLFAACACTLNILKYYEVFLHSQFIFCNIPVCTCLLLSTVCLLTAYFVVLWTMFWVLNMLRTYMFCLLICLHWGSERNSISIPSLSCTCVRIDNKLETAEVMFRASKHTRPLLLILTKYPTEWQIVCAARSIPLLSFTGIYIDMEACKWKVNMAAPPGEDSSTCRAGNGTQQWQHRGQTESPAVAAVHWLTRLSVFVWTTPSLSLFLNNSPLASGGGFWRAGGGGRGRGQSLPAVDCPASYHLPLKDAGVLPAYWEQVGVTVGEADVGDVAAVALVLVARCLEGKEWIHFGSTHWKSPPFTSPSPLCLDRREYISNVQPIGLLSLPHASSLCYINTHYIAHCILHTLIRLLFCILHFTFYFTF